MPMSLQSIIDSNREGKQTSELIALKKHNIGDNMHCNTSHWHHWRVNFHSICFCLYTQHERHSILAMNTCTSELRMFSENS